MAKDGLSFISARFLYTALFLTILAPSSVRAGENPPGNHPVTVDDVLRIEGIGEAAFSANGRWLAYNLLPPYDSLSDYSYWLYAFSLSGHQLWIKDLRQDGKPRLQPGLDTSATNYLMGFSPDDRRVIVLEHRLGRLRLIACRIGRADCAHFNAMPDIRDMYFGSAPWNERLIWTSDHSFVMPTRDEEHPGSEMRSRGLSGTYLWREWNKAWLGREPTASEAVSTSRNRSQDWASGELIEFDVIAGSTRKIADGRYAGVQVSPDGRFLIAARVGERERPSADARPVPAETHPVFDRRYALRVIDAKSGEVREAAGPFNVDPNSLTWSLDGKHFAVFGWDRGKTAADGDFYVFDIGTLTARRQSTKGFVLANNRLAENMPWALGPARAILLDTSLILYARPESSDRYDWYRFNAESGQENLSAGLEAMSGNPLYADAKGISVVAKNGVYQLGVDGRRLRLTPERDMTFRNLAYQLNAAHGWANEYRFSSDLIRNPLLPVGAIALSDKDSGDDRAVAFVDFRAPEPPAVMLDLNIPGAKILAASTSAHAAVVTVRDGAATRLLLVGSARAPIELARINEHLNRIVPPTAEKVEYTLNDPNGKAAPRQTPGCLLLPPDYEKRKRYPLVIEVYPTGRAGGCGTLTDAPSPNPMTRDLWTSRGFIYIRPAMPLDFARTKDGPIAGMGAVVDQTIDALVQQGYVDPHRVVLFGESQGGISSLSVATQSNKFAAVISMNGWSDFLSHYFGARGLMRYFHLDQNGGDNRWRYDCMGEGADNMCPFGFAATPFDDPTAYTNNSPVTLAKRITAPVLLVHSDLDYIDIAQYDEMFGALYRAGKEARYVRYWGEGHTPSSPANIRDLWRRIDEFLRENGVTPGGD
jgi:dipeptidyl aminopeptidase/acylaminoacyl peptidase